jgi:hypothetical protein
VYNLAHLSLSAESISTLNSEPSEEDYFQLNRSATSSFLSIGSQDSQHAANFDHDASASIYDSLVEGHSSDNIQLELTALRMSTNASEHQLRHAIVTAFVKHIVQQIKSGTSIREAVAQVFAKHRDLVNKSIFDKNQASKVDQVDFMLLLQRDLSHKESGDQILLSAATKLVELDSVEDDGILQWWEDARSSESEELQDVKAKTQQLIDFLNQSSEEESEEEDGDDEESE